MKKTASVILAGLLMSGMSFAAPHVAGVAALEFARAMVSFGGAPVPFPSVTAPVPDATPTPVLPTGLFLGTQVQGARSMTGRPGLLRSRTVEINFNVIPRAGAASAHAVEQITFNLFDDVTYLATQERVEPSDIDPNGYIWFGRLEGQDHGQVILVIGDGQVEGTVELLDKRFQVTYAGGGTHAVNELDRTAAVPLDDDVLIPQGQDGVHVTTDVRSVASNLSIVDLMVVYTSAARAYRGSATLIENDIQLAVAYMNQSLLNSGVNARMRLAHVAEVAYTESGNSYTDLSRLQQTDDGQLDEVHLWRNTYAADLVSLVTSSGSSICGVAFVSVSRDMAWAAVGFSLVRAYCLTGISSHVLAHELGHNLGSDHDRAYASNAGAYSYSYGYIDPNGYFRDIMSYAYACAAPCPQINYYSNNTRTMAGRPIGNAITDAARTFNNSAPLVAAFRNGDLTTVTPTPTPTLPSSPVPSPTPTSTPPPGCNFTIPAGNVEQFISAINSANANGSGNDVVCLVADSTYTFSVPAVDPAEYIFSALPPITSTVTILGNGATLTRTGSQSLNFFYVDFGGNLTLDNIALTGGRCVVSSADYDRVCAGAIDISRGSLTITNSILTGNMSYFEGGAIRGLSGSTVRIKDTIFTGNSSSSGGAVYLSFADQLTVTRSLFLGNAAQEGSAISVWGDNTTLVSITDSCFVRNANVSITNNDDWPAAPVNAINNWWGAPFGPSLPDGSVMGTGDIVDPTGVIYQPFLTRVPEFCIPPPVLLAPGATSPNPPTFTWEVSLDAASYDVQYGDTNPPTSQATTTTASFKPPAPLLIKTYYWRVRTIYLDGQISPWSETRSVSIESPAGAAPVRNRYTTATPALSWSHIEWAVAYEVQVSTTTAFAAPLSFSREVPGNALQVSTTPLADGLYYWRARAKRADGTWGPWSAAEGVVVDGP